MKKRVKTKKFILLGILSSLLIAGITWQSVMNRMEYNKYAAVGEYVDTESYKAHYYTKGIGKTAFVFITGSGTPSAYTDFYNLQNVLSTKGQTITFDHAGSGWSSDTKSERSIENLTAELSAIVESAAPDKSIVLLCHSLGSLEAIGFAQAYPKKVKGIIFLDTGSPEYYSTYSELGAKIVNRSMAFTRAVGINRMFGECGLFLPMYGENKRNRQLPEELKDIDKVMYYRFAGNPSSLNTIKLINENATKVLNGKSLGDIPILVLSSDSGQKWFEVQKNLSSWSTNSKLVTIRGAEHYMYWSNYNEVVSCIEEFVEENMY